MKNVLLMSLCALALAGCNGQPRASRGDCERLRAHAAALELHTATEHGLGRMDPALARPPLESGNFDGGFATSAEQAARYHRAKARGQI